MGKLSKIKNYYLLSVVLLLIIIGLGYIPYKTIKMKLSLIYFVRKGSNVKEIEGFGQIYGILQKEKHHYYLISIFNNICMVFPSGQLIERMKELHKINREIYFVMLIPENFTDNDLENLKANIGIWFHVERMDKKLSERLSKLTPVVLIIDKKGRVIDFVFQEHERRLSDLIERLSKRAKSES